MKYLVLTLPFLLVTVSQAASLPINHDARLQAGAIASLKADAYAADDKIGISPLFLYDNNRFYLEGAEGGYYPYKDSQNWVRIGLSYDDTHFEPKDAKSTQLKQLDERKPSINAHVSYMHITPVGGFEIKAAKDISNHSDGQIISLTHRSKFTFLDDNLTVYPKVGATWYDKKHNNYYYGVSDAEVAKSGLRSYQAKSGISPYISASAFYKINDRISAFGNQKFEWLSSTQKDSPLTDGSTKSSTSLGLLYQF
ncbi:MipA/OmpV family protein [Moraxella nasovis]|uniref:MipA/OmpV family protein n=1 Tax=Moraxella nasovis TaxID=2904121 RepID=UPI001F620EE2|nr:MipA/OmpV family protein [Moraxella nasovis]UNU73491.1 MipA/OmpV family protein [Moraxella nasovis]